MDIASLLSNNESTQNGNGTTAPQNSAAAQSGARKRSRPLPGSRTTSLLSQEVIISPSPEPPRSSDDQVMSQQNRAPDSSAFSPQYPADQTRTLEGTANTPLSYLQSPIGTLQAAQRPSLLEQHRHSSMSNIDAVSDVSTKAQPGTPHGVVSRPDLMGRSPSLQHVKPANPRTYSASDLIMAEAPAQTPPPRTFSASSISEEDTKTIRDLSTYLAEHSYDYNSHVQLISLLHTGLLKHVNTAPQDGNQQNDPRDYPLLPDLRMARNAMDSRYAVGEDVWRDWINDESMLAHTSEERDAVRELCIKAVEEEPASVVLWSLYGEWVWSTYAIANGIMEGDEDTWTEDDKLICREIFTRQMVFSVWGQAVESTRWRLDESHVIWNRYAELLMQDVPNNPSAETIDEIQLMYMNRLQIPHARWEATSQAFWSFISRHKPDSWEEVMSTMNELAAPARQECTKRDAHELNLTSAFRSGDNTALYNAFASYLDSESKYRRKVGPFDVELRAALYERALVKFPTMVEWWLDYVDFITTRDTTSIDILPMLERATRHCPWSGELWSRRLLRVELDTKSYEEVENVKHKATNSGLLPTGGMEEILLLYATWCSFLRRRAFSPDATEEDVDMAEMAISTVRGDIELDGKKAYGDEFQGDPFWRIEKIQIKFLTQARRINEARNIWKELIQSQGSNYDFWLQYYEWEIFVWGSERTVFGHREQTLDLSPKNASDVLREALKQKTLDWPEKIHHLYAHHFQTHESPEETQKAQVELRRSRKILKIRREREAETSAMAAAESQARASSNQGLFDEIAQSSKRKREDESELGGDSVKRSRPENVAPDDTTTEQEFSAAAQVKRDREHNTITVLDLPGSVVEKHIRQFFSNCGEILSVDISADESNKTASATVEFANHEDVLAACTRDGKTVDGSQIRVKPGTQSTLYVTNYPASWAEDTIRDLFKSYGTITTIRFPSLKFNQRRRFCYIQFLTAQEAQAATALNDKAIDRDHRLVAVISDPDAKKSRKGPISEGREVFVGNVEHAATEQEIKDFFTEAGQVENVRMMRSASGKFTGTCFVVFSDSEAAQQALTFNNKPLQSRLLRVSLATDKSTRDAANKKHGTTKVFEPASSASPAPEGASPANATSFETSDRSDTAKTKHQRTIALLDLPDTVNDARVYDLFTKLGPIRKLTVRRDKGGAMIEFVNIADAGKAGLGVDVSALGPDCKIATVPELLQVEKKKKKNQGPNSSSTTNADKGAVTKLKPAVISRPGQGARRGRGGKRGGLGFKRGGAVVADSSKANGASQESGGSSNNAHFRELFLAGKQDASQE